MTDLGEMKKILGLRVERNHEKGTLKISQEPYIDIILTRFHMQDANSVSTPLSKSVTLTMTSKDTDLPKIDVPYAKAVGSLMYATLGTRPDLAFAIQHLSKFTTSYGPEPWTALKHVFHYQKGTRNVGIIFKKDANAELQLYVDSGFAHRADALSIGGYVAMFGGGCIACILKKQRTVALSMTEAEYIVLTEGAKQLIWPRCALQELGFDQEQPTLIQCDNLGAITISHDTTYHARTKHISIAYHFIRKKVASNQAALTYVQSKENPAGIMMEGLGLQQHKYLCKRLGMETPQIEGKCWANQKQGSGGGLTVVDSLEVDEMEGGGQSSEEDNSM